MSSSPTHKREIIAIDIDGTLTESVCFTVEEVEAAIPRPGAAETVNAAFDQGYVIIYTARRDHLISPTLGWLRRHGFRWHAISNNKIPFDRYIDNDSCTL